MLITLSQWANNNFSISFGAGTLNKWARHGKISPAPTKIGNRWMVHPNAKYVEKTIEYQRTRNAQKELNHASSACININDRMQRIINNDSKAA